MASTYMPYDSVDPPPPTITQDPITFCNRKGWGLIIGSDANSHNECWGSTDTNTHGEKLLEYLATTQMHICNSGNKATFSNSVRKEAIDITLASNHIIDKVENWLVSDRETFSDHHMIEFSLMSNATLNMR